MMTFGFSFWKHVHRYRAGRSCPQGHGPHNSVANTTLFTHTSEPPPPVPLSSSRVRDSFGAPAACQTMAGREGGGDGGAQIVSSVLSEATSCSSVSGWRAQ